MEENNKIKVAIIAGVHGNELQTVYECNNIMHTIDKVKHESNLYDKLDIKFNPFINFNGIRENNRDYVNYGDINRMMTEYNGIAELNSLIDWCDIIIDMHCSPRCADFMFLDIVQYKVGNIVEWCKQHNILYGINHANNNTIKNYASSKGKIALTWEQSGMEIINYLHSSHVINTFITDIIPSLPELITVDTINTKLEIINSVISDNEGIIAWYKDVGERISKGDTLCEITDYKTIIGDKPLTTIIKSPVDGVIIDLCPRDYTLRGWLLAEIQPM